MSLKNSYTTSDYVPWDIAMDLVRKLYDDGDFRMSLFIGCGCFFGLRVSDLRCITWEQIFRKDEFVVYEYKTGKRRVVRINRGFQSHIERCHWAMKVKDDSRPCFLSRYGSLMSTQMLNRILKKIRRKYDLPVNNFSTHSLRKTFSRQVYESENAQGRGEMALLKLSELLNHSSPAITRRYIGLRQQELGEMYDSLKF